ncbi:serine hydrolase domain-containing protein [Hoeflea prorocentri]|uniref:Serine hydrolase n=1 Tax=Hoeflea prorocentri TaxID=1922333 RepID=A0A9X3UM21_9HYPH|nr:serine hydrolase [Hoeflea prorocentri]MCY6383094.1 serine hydrolase [Hoeflea prorocentri]MDA5400894.1 serine hydrolase [Hoeflea prorocentri]
MARKIWIALAVVLFAVLGGATYYWNDIRDIRALIAYGSAFEAENIDEAFRSFHKTYPAIRIERGQTVRSLEPVDGEIRLPAHYRFDGQTYSVEDTLEEIHQTGLVILKGDTLLYEDYRRGNTGDTHAIIMSVSKSVASILAGKAFEDKDIESLDDPVTKYAPSLVGSAYDGVTVQQILDMSSGIRWDEDYDDLNSDIVRMVAASLTGSFDDFAITLQREFEPGTFNRYASIDTQILAMVIRGATKRSYSDYLENEFWKKIGAESDAYILTDAVGEPSAMGGLSVTARDLARIGLLVLEGGTTFGDDRIVSEDWLKRSARPDAPHLMPGRDNPNSDYGLGYKNQWWIPLEQDSGDFAAIGIHGQFLYINPERQIVIAMNATYPEYNEDEDMEYRVLTMLQSIAKEVSEQRP